MTGYTSLFILSILSRRGDLMAITNYERVGKALELLRDGLRPFVTRELEAKHGKYWITAVTTGWPRDLDLREGEGRAADGCGGAAAHDVGRVGTRSSADTLGFTERSIVSELREVRNKWAHQEPFSSDDAYRAPRFRGPACSPPSPRPRPTRSRR